ncbi:methyltransferase domain-containing protein [Candidatus Woesearchaeota archaeon]|nr:methyltransferase domain-containing protein [Candidatus Woesearchaeota archaeon]
MRELEVRIKKYLAENDIKRMDHAQSRIALMDKALVNPLLNILYLGMVFSQSQTNKIKLMKLLQNHSQTNHIFESDEISYDGRINALKFLSGFLDTQPKDGLVVVDYGCGFGYNLCFLAQNSGNKFRGYDIESIKLMMARERASKYNNGNVEFHHGDYFNPKQIELESADILYTRSPLPDTTLDVDTIKNFLDKIRVRTKKEGYLILEGITRLDSSHFPDGLLLKKEERTFPIERNDIYGYVFQRTA